MPNLGLIDCGSNTVRLCIYQVSENARPPFERKDFSLLLNHKVMAGLASQIEDGLMTKRGVKKAASAIKGHLQTAEFFDCERLDVFATAFLRNCDNSDQAKAAIEAACGATINVLSARDEAHLGFVGARCATKGMDRGTLVDIGGGSTELTRIEDATDSDDISIAQGSLSSFVESVHGVIPDQHEQQAIAERFRGLLEKVPTYDRYRAPLFYGVGGSVRAVARIYGEALGDGKRPDVMEAMQVKDLLAFAQRDPSGFAHAALRVTPDRVHTALPGCILLDVVMDDFGARQLELCRCGVREGYLLERMLQQ